MRDKVYSVIGLLDVSRHCRPTTIRPDYSPHIAFDPLILSVFLESLTGQGGLQCLSCCTSMIKDTTPSWMSAVNTGFHFPNELTQRNLWVAGGMAAGRCPSQVRCVSSGPLVSFRVTHLGAISRILGPFPGEGDIDKRMRHIQQPREYFEMHIEMSVGQLADYWSACKTLAETTIGSVPTTPEETSDLLRRAFLFDIDPSFHSPVNATSFRRNSGLPPAYDVKEIARERPVLFGLMGGCRSASRMRHRSDGGGVSSAGSRHPRERVTSYALSIAVAPSNRDCTAP